MSTVTTTRATTDVDAPEAPRTSGQPVWPIVMVREIVVKLRDRNFVVGTVITLVLIAGGLALQAFLSGKSNDVTAVVTGDGARPVMALNELEYVKGEIYANVWHQNRVARIDPQTGQVKGWIDLSGLLKAGDVTDEEAVLNGIAYDEAGDRLFVTGKLWPKLFEVRLKDR